MSVEDDIAKLQALLNTVAPKKPKKEPKPEPTKADHLAELAKGVSTTSYQTSLLEKKKLLKETLEKVQRDNDLREFGKHRYTPVVPGPDETWQQPVARRCHDCGKPKGTC